MAEGLGRRPGLDALRGAAALSVIVVHTDIGPARAGRVGVTVFFVLSGFLITSGLLDRRDDDNRSLREFYERRARRLFPALIPVLVVGGALNVAIRPDVNPVMTAIAGLGFFTNAYQALGNEVGVNGGLWSLAVEEHFYLAWPVLVWAVPARRLHVVIGSIVAGSLLAGLLIPASDALQYWLTPFRVGELGLGALAAILWRSRHPRILRPTAWTAAAGLYLVAARPFSEDYIPLGPALGGLCAAVLTLYLLESPGWRPLNACGRLSYGIYLWHAPVYMVLEHRGLAGWWLLVTSLPTSVLIAAASHRWIETRWLRGRADRMTDTGGMAEEVAAASHDGPPVDTRAATPPGDIVSGRGDRRVLSTN